MQDTSTFQLARRGSPSLLGGREIRPYAPCDHPTTRPSNYRTTFPLHTDRSLAPKRYLYSSFPRMKSNSLRPCSQAHCRLWDSKTQPGDNSMKSWLTPEL